MESQRPPPSSLPLILGLGLFGTILLTCLMGLLGPALLYVVLIVGAGVLIGGVHYLLWGQSLKQGSEPGEHQDEN